MPDSSRNLRSAAYFLVILAAYLLVGAGFALRTPAWQAPDEPAHYNYVAQVAANGCCPVIEPGDWNAAYLSELTSSRFNPALLDNLPALQYEDHQPPLYYLLAAPVFTLANGSLIALRLLSVIFGAGVVACAYAVGGLLLPQRPQVALGAALFVAFLPQHTAILASVNNDSLAELLVGMTLLGTLLYLKRDAIRPWQLGVLVGLCLLTKLSTLFLAGLAPLAIVVCWRLVEPRRASALVRALLLFAVPALLLAGVWWVRNLGVYGFPDLFGLRAHNLVVFDQPRTAARIAEIGFGAYLREGLEITFNSFWGQFGWMGLPLPDWTYRLIQLFVAIVAAGLLLDIFILQRRSPAVINGDDKKRVRAAWGVLILAALLGVAQYVYYNVEFLQFQGRYLYPALIPVGLWVAVGLDAWGRLFGRGALQPSARWLAAGTALLVPLDLFILWRIIPLLAA